MQQHRRQRFNQSLAQQRLASQHRFTQYNLQAQEAQAPLLESQ